MKKYPKMKDSGIGWIKTIPENWNVKRLKFTTKFDLSTIDRHEYDNEEQVSICHYPQVYNNEIISLKTKLSKGTCTQKELEKFRLKKDDVLITKDSETQDDIGVPVYIQDDFENAVCGYHIAQLFTDKKKILGSFLFRFIQSNISNAYFETEANGITRFGLGKDSINNLKIIFPSITEQKLIIDFFEKEISKIDYQILKIQKLYLILKEKEEMIINYTVTKGLDPSVPMKNSGIGWLGEIPKTWGIQKITSCCELRGRIGWKGLSTEDYREKGPILLGVTNISKNFKLDLKKLTRISQESYEDSPEIFVEKNDILLAKSGATTGKVCIVENVFEETTVNAAVNIIRINKNYMEPKYFYLFLRSKILQDVLYSYAFSSAQPNLFQRDIKKISIVIPSIQDQKEIIKFINNKITKIHLLISNTESQIQKLKEYRQSLISSVVTGKIDVREAVA